MGSTRIEFHYSIPEIAEEWLGLEKVQANPSIQNNYLLLNAWYRCYLDGRKAAFISVWHDNTCLGIYPFTIEKKFGATVYNTLYHESLSISKPIVRDGQDEFFFIELVRHLHEHRRIWDVIKFSNLYCFDNEERLLTSAITRNTMLVHTVHDHTYTIDSDGSFEEYCQRYLSRKTRENLARLMKNIATLDSNFVYYLNFEALQHLRRFYEMENTGWKKDAGTALINRNDNLVYLESLIHNCCLSGKFFMSFLEIEGMKVAGQLGYIEDGVYHALRTAYDRAFAKLGPSVVLIAKTIRLLRDAFPEVQTINCFPRSYGYKQKYAQDRCECNTHVVFSNSLKGKLLFKAYKYKMSRKMATPTPDTCPAQ